MGTRNMINYIYISQLINKRYFLMFYTSLYLAQRVNECSIRIIFAKVCLYSRLSGLLSDNSGSHANYHDITTITSRSRGLSVCFLGSSRLWCPLSNVRGYYGDIVRVETRATMASVRSSG